MRTIFLCLLTHSLCLPLFAQNKLAEKLIQSLDSFNTIYPQEKIFLHADKDYYQAGETIWFKTYVTLDQKLTYLSQVVYVFLVNDKGEIVQKLMLPLKNGTANGDFSLPSILPYGNYSLQSATLWMMNNIDFIYRKPIFIESNTLPTTPPEKNNNKEQLEVDFFAEGGNFIAGIQNKLAMKITTKNGLPFNVPILITDRNFAEIATTTAIHNGISCVNLVPDENEQYWAFVFKGTPSEKKYPLPKPQKKGVVLLVNNKSDRKLFAQIEVAEFEKETYKQCLLVAQMNNNVVYSAMLNTTEGAVTAIIEKETLPDGIMQLVLFTTSGEQIAERLVFINNSRLEAVTIDSIENLKTDRKANNFTIQVNDTKNPALSISITNANESMNTAENIISNQLLTSNSSDYIYQPNWYFSNKNINGLPTLDVLLLTQKWTRFDWNKIAKNEFPAIKYMFENGLSISGVVTKPQSTKTIANGKVTFIIQAEDSSKIISKVDADKNGLFFLPNINFKKSATIYFQSANVDNEKALTEIKINTSFIDTISYLSPTAIDLNPANLIDEYQKSNTATSVFKDKPKDRSTLETVTVKAKIKSPEQKLTEEYSSTIFSLADQTLIPDDAAYVNVWQFLQAQVNGMNIERVDGIMSATFNRNNNLFVDPTNIQSTAIQFFLNEIPISEDLLESINIKDIALIQVYRTNTSYLLGSPNGAIALYTVKGKSTKDWREKGFDFFKKVGYNYSRTFLEPNYILGKLPYTTTDVRPTLQWVPNIKLNNEGVTRHTFFTDEVTKKVKIIVQGIDENGKLIYAEKIME